MNDSKFLLGRFFGGTILFSWMFWSPGVLSTLDILPVPQGILALCKFIGASGPAVMALILSYGQGGKGELKRILRSSFNVRQNSLILLSAAAVLIGLHYLARLLYARTGIQLPRSEMVQSPLMGIVFFIAAFLVGGGLGEEIGWRGFALEKLQKKHSALASSMLLSAVWIIWHLPLFYYSGTNQSLFPFWAFIITVFPLGIMLTFVYNNTGTIFAAAFFHTMGNLANEIFRVLPTQSSPGLWGYFLLTGLYYLAALVIVLTCGAEKAGRGTNKE